MKKGQESNAWANYKPPIGRDDVSCERSFFEKLVDEAFTTHGVLVILIIAALVYRLISFLSSL